MGRSGEAPSLSSILTPSYTDIPLRARGSFLGSLSLSPHVLWGEEDVLTAGTLLCALQEQPHAHLAIHHVLHNVDRGERRPQ